MRKITSKKDERRKKTKNQIILGGILIIVMFFSVLGYSFQGRDAGSSAQKTSYNGFEFAKQGEFWFTRIGDFDFVFRNNPSQSKDISVNSEIKYLNNYYGKPLYVSSDSRMAESEIYSNLGQVVQRMQRACFDADDKKCDESLPIKTCRDNFIIIQESNYTEIIQQDSCVFIRGGYGNLTRLTDKFLFKVLGIE